MSLQETLFVFGVVKKCFFKKHFLLKFKNFVSVSSRKCIFKRHFSHGKNYITFRNISKTIFFEEFFIFFTLNV